MKKVVIALIGCIVVISSLILPAFADNLPNNSNKNTTIGYLCIDTSYYSTPTKLTESNGIPVKSQYEAGMPSSFSETIFSMLEISRNGTRIFDYIIPLYNGQAFYLNLNGDYETFGVYTDYGTTNVQTHQIFTIEINHNIATYYDFGFLLDTDGKIRCVPLNYDNEPVALYDITWYVQSSYFPADNLLSDIGDFFFEAGYNEGANVTYNEAYTAGVLAGQDVNSVVGDGIEGFFGAIYGFFYPFLSLGIGSLTVGSLLSLAIIVFLVITVIKIVRGT